MSFTVAQLMELPSLRRAKVLTGHISRNSITVYKAI